MVFAPESEAGGFDPWGRPVAAIWEQREIKLRDFEQRVHLYADSTAQAARLAELAAQYGSANPTFAVGIADPDVAPLLENELNRLMSCFEYSGEQGGE